MKIEIVLDDGLVQQFLIARGVSDASRDFAATVDTMKKAVTEYIKEAVASADLKRFIAAKNGEVEVKKATLLQWVKAS